MQRRILYSVITFVTLIVVGVVVGVVVSQRSNPPATESTLVRYRNEEGRLKILQKASKVRDLKLVNAMVIDADSQLLEELIRDPNIEDVKREPRYYPTSAITPYGLSRVQGGPYNQQVPSVSISGGGCGDPETFRIGVVDSGLSVAHPDFFCGDIAASNTRCLGREFGLRDTWHDPVDSHGTHVSGTIASAHTGVIQDGNVCLIMARVFNDQGGSAAFADIYDAVEWLAYEQNARVINMSLGGGGRDQSAEDLLVKVRADTGALVVAAAGNAASNQPDWPSGYASVLSISATNDRDELADFSNFHNTVDLTAPGAGVLSTVPFRGSDTLIVATVDGDGYLGDVMDNSRPIQGDEEGELVDCGYGTSPCPGNGGHICLIKRGDDGDKSTTFQTKTKNCETSGAVAAFIFNDDRGGLFRGTLDDNNKIKIPALSLSDTDGEYLRVNKLGEDATVDVITGYAFSSGTSMASPHVAGVASLIWR